MILSFDSKLKLFPNNLRSRLRGTYGVLMVYPYGAIKLENYEGLKFKLNFQRLKYYIGDTDEV